MSNILNLSVILGVDGIHARIIIAIFSYSGTEESNGCGLSPFLILLELQIERSSLNNQAAVLKNQIDAGHSSLYPKYKQILHQLEALDQIHANGLRVRSRIRWAEEGESSTSFFFKSVKKQQSQSTIFTVKNNDGNYVSFSKDLLHAWQEFYSNLFSREDTDNDLQNILLRRLESRLDPSQAKLCEGLLTKEECFSALKGMSHN